MLQRLAALAACAAVAAQLLRASWDATVASSGDDLPKPAQAEATAAGSPSTRRLVRSGPRLPGSLRIPRLRNQSGDALGRCTARPCLVVGGTRGGAATSWPSAVVICVEIKFRGSS